MSGDVMDEKAETIGKDKILLLRLLLPLFGGRGR